MAEAGLHLQVPLLGLSMAKVKRQVEDLCFQINDPLSYQLLQQRCSDPVFLKEIALSRRGTAGTLGSTITCK